MTINTAALAKSLMPGVNSWFGLSYSQYPEQWKEIFDMFSSEKNYEEDVNVHGFGLAAQKPEGTAIVYDTMQQAFIKRYSMLTYALGYVITREAIEDNQYAALMEQRTKALAMSMAQTKENVGANILNRAFSSSYTGADGLSLCNASHKLSKGGTFANQIAVAADLSETSLEQGLIDISNMINDAGLRISIQGQKLIVPPQLMFEAKRILGSDLQNDTANNAINAMKSMGMLPKGYVVNNYLTDSNAWFIKTNCPEGLKYFDRRPLMVENDTDFDTENMKFKASFRCAFGWTDPRGVYGSAGA